MSSESTQWCHLMFLNKITEFKLVILCENLWKPFLFLKLFSDILLKLSINEENMTTVDFSCVSSLCVFSTKSSIKGSSFLLSLDMVLNIPARILLLLVSTSIADRLYSLTEEVQHLTCQSSHMCTQFTPSHHPDASVPHCSTPVSVHNACCSWFILWHWNWAQPKCNKI